MRALIGNDMGLSAFTTVERQVLAEDPDRNDRPFCEILGDVNGLPITAKVAPGQCTRPRVHEVVDLFDDTVKLGVRIDGRRHFLPLPTCVVSFTVCAYATVATATGHGCLLTMIFVFTS